MSIQLNVWQSVLAERLGWTLLYSLVEGMAAAILLAITLGAMRRAAPAARYAVACVAMLLVLVMTIATFARLGAVVGVSVTRSTASVAPVSIGENVASVSPPAASAGLRRTVPWLGALWIAGVIVLGVNQMAGWMMIQRIRRKVEAIGDRRIWEIFVELKERMGIRRAVEVGQSALVQTPSVIGWLAPLVLLPAEALTGLNGEQLRGLIAHELAHVRRRDYLANLIQTAIETLLFFNPAIWWIGRVIRQERENCCDDVAASLGDRAVYAAALASMEELRATAAPALSGRGGRLLPRIARLLGRQELGARRTWSWATGVLLLLIVLGVVGFRQKKAQAQDASTKPSSGVCYIGGVERSGVYEIAGKATRVRGMLIAAGFPNDPAHKDLMLIRRDDRGEPKIVLDLSQLLNDPTGGPELRDGDVLIVSTRKAPGEQIYFMAGSDVPRPGSYSLAGRPEGVTLLQALIAAGVNPAEKQNAAVNVHRESSVASEREWFFRVGELLRSDTPPFVLMPGDHVVVADSDFAPAANTGAVKIIGDRPAEDGSTRGSVTEPISGDFGFLSAMAKATAPKDGAGTIILNGPSTPRKAVRLVVGADVMTLEGQTVTPDTLMDALSTYPDLANTVLQFAVDNDSITVKRENEGKNAAMKAVQDHMKYFDDIGIHPIGSKAGDK